tara:strand:+ start:551 stop:1009 length:459 start_codon:yes stop_codon:yes gene_type:complete
MKKQNGPFKLKYKKSAFPFMENFHVKKHGKLKIERKKSTKDQIDEIKNPIETEPYDYSRNRLGTTRQGLDSPKRQPGSGKRGKIGPPPSKKQPEKLPEFMNKPGFDSGISIYGDKKFLNKKSSRPSKKRASRRGAAGTGIGRIFGKRKYELD